MSLTNLDSAGLIKAFVGYCLPKYQVTFSVVHSGQIKKITDFYEYIERIEGINLTTQKKTSLSAVTSNNDWYHDRDAGIVYYYTTAPSVTVVIRFGFYFKTGDTEVFKTSITTGELVYYHGRMMETSFNQSIDDISNGTLGVYSTSIQFINNDGFYNYLAKDNISFVGSEMLIRLFVNDITNNIVVFRGTVDRATYNGNEFSLSVKDIIKAFDSQPRYTTNDADYIVTSSNYPNANENAIDQRIPYILGRKLNSGLKKGKIFGGPDVIMSGGILTSLGFISFLNSEKREKNLLEVYSKGNKQVYFYDSNGNAYIPDVPTYGSTNVRYRKYISCITDNPIQTYTSILTVTWDKIKPINQTWPTGVSYVGSFTIVVPDTSLYFEGQCLSIESERIGATPYNYNYLTLNSNNPHFYIGKIDHVNSKLYCYSSHLPDLKEAYGYNRYDIYFHPISIYIKQSDNSYISTPAFDIESTQLSDGRYRHSFYIKRFATNSGHYSFSENSNTSERVRLFEYDTDVGTLNDTTTELSEQNFCALFAQQTTNLSLGNIIHKTARWAGLETDGGSGYIVTNNPCSFKDLDTKIGTTTFDIASTDEETYLGLLQRMLSSVFGFLYLRNDGKLGVRLFEQTPYDSQLWVLSEDNIVNGSISSEYDCSEIKTRIKYIPPTGEDFSKQKQDFDKLQLHGDILIEEENYIENQSLYETKVLNRKYSYYSSPIKRFNFTIINNGYEIVLGDRISVNFQISQKWLGEDKTYELFVIGLNKSLRGVDVVAIENKFPSI